MATFIEFFSFFFETNFYFDGAFCIGQCRRWDGFFEEKFTKMMNSASASSSTHFADRAVVLKKKKDFFLLLIIWLIILMMMIGPFGFR